MLGGFWTTILDHICSLFFECYMTKFQTLLLCDNVNIMVSRSLLYVKLNPQNISEKEKVARLEVLLSKYLVIKFLGELGENDLLEMNQKEFKTPDQVVAFFKGHIPKFKEKYSKFTDDFIKEYVK